MKRTFPAVAVFSVTVFAQSYDLVLKGGHVIDPKNNVDGVMDVAITGNKIERVAANIPATAAKKVIDVGGLYVPPGVIVGVKTAHYQGPEWIAVDNAVAAGKLANIPVVVDFGRPWPERSYVKLVTEHLRPGDISTHMYSTASEPLVGNDGKVLPALV